MKLVVLVVVAEVVTGVEGGSDAADRDFGNL